MLLVEKRAAILRLIGELATDSSNLRSFIGNKVSVSKLKLRIYENQEAGTNLFINAPRMR